MEKKVFVVYRCNTWLSLDSRFLVGVCSSHGQAEDVAFDDCEILDQVWTDDDSWNIYNLSQTQCGQRDFNWLIEEVEMDVLL